METHLCDYVTAAGHHELLAVMDEPTLTYRILLRRPDGGTRTLRQLVPSLRNARRWAMHYRHKALREDLDLTADLGRPR
jgi:hypothetical protein